MDSAQNGTHVIQVAEKSLSATSPATDQNHAYHVTGDATFASALQMQIVFKDLKCTVKVKSKESAKLRPLSKVKYEDKDIIRNVSGLISPGRVTAVMGASGAGKTTFLNVLAGVGQPNARISGQILVNQQPISSGEMQQISGFVHQEDVIMDTMTVREALLFAAFLKLPKEVSMQLKAERALKVADLLNLTKSLDNMVGSSLMKGISGGEKRRLSLGMEMITNPSILFLDEPTSGLDTYTAFKVMRILNNVAHSQGRTMVATIHQPSSDIFHLFDDLMVLAEGQMLYLGEAKKMVDYFDELGYHCPRYTNPADFLFMDVLYLGKTENISSYNLAALDQLEGSKHDGEKARLENEQRVKTLLGCWPKSKAYSNLMSSMENDKLLPGGVQASAIMDTASFALQFVLLSKRAMLNQFRNKLILPAKAGQTIFLSVIVGLIYLQVGNDYSSVQDRQGSLFFLTVQGLFGSVMGTMTVYGAEKAVFMREYSSRMYSLPGYFFSRFIVELPTHIVLPFIMACITYWMVGYQAVAVKFFWYSLIFVLMDSCGAALGIFVSCIFNNIEVALAVMPMVLLPLMVFSGFFVNSDSIPPYFMWISYLSPMRYGFAALGLNEFSGLKIKCGPSDPCKPGFSGDDVINGLNFSGTVESNAAIMFGYMWGCVLLAYVALWVNIRVLKK